MHRILTDQILTDQLSRQQLNVHAKDSPWDVLSCWGGSSGQLSTTLWMLQKWDKAPEALCWHTAALWPVFLAQFSLLEPCPALGPPRSSEAGLGEAGPWLEPEADALSQLVFLLVLGACS